MIIIAGELRLEPGDRQRYLDAVAEVTRQARNAPGCLDFVQAPDPLEPDRVIVYERWHSDEDLHRFRDSDASGPDAPPLRSGDVSKYRIAAVEQP